MSDFIVIRDLLNNPSILKDKEGNSIGNEKLMKKLLYQDRSLLKGNAYHERRVSPDGFLRYIILDLEKLDLNDFKLETITVYLYRRNKEKIVNLIKAELRDKLIDSI
jgi:hypothetical protein